MHIDHSKFQLHFKTAIISQLPVS